MTPKFQTCAWEDPSYSITINKKKIVLAYSKERVEIILHGLPFAKLSTLGSS